MISKVELFAIVLLVGGPIGAIANHVGAMTPAATAFFRAVNDPNHGDVQKVWPILAIDEPNPSSEKTPLDSMDFFKAASRFPLDIIASMGGAFVVFHQFEKALANGDPGRIGAVISFFLLSQLFAIVCAIICCLTLPGSTIKIPSQSFSV